MAAPRVRLSIGDLAQALADVVEPLLQERLRTSVAEAAAHAATAAVRAELSSWRAPLTVTVHRDGDGVAVDVGPVHVQFSELLAALTRGEHVLLSGPPGSGKSMAAAQAAAALGLPLVAVTCGPQLMESRLLGYDAFGRYVRGALYDAATHGGLVLLDELDAAPPGLPIALHGLLDGPGRPYTWPSGETLVVHPQFRTVATCNTLGRGGDTTFADRVALDPATRDRFHVIVWRYDAALDRTILGPQDGPERALVDALLAAREALAERAPTSLSVRVLRRVLDAHRRGHPEPWSVATVGLDPDSTERLVTAVRKAAS